MSRQGPNGRQQKREGSEINLAGDPGHKPAWSAQRLEEGPRATEVTKHKVTQVAFCCSVKSIYWSSTVYGHCLQCWGQSSDKSSSETARKTGCQAEINAVEGKNKLEERERVMGREEHFGWRGI